MKFSALTAIAGGTILKLYKDVEITFLVVDSRKALIAEGAVFFAIAGQRHDGHAFIAELYRLGLRQFVLEKPLPIDTFPEGNFLLVPSSLAFLQSVAVNHRRAFSIPVIGITGSNGKTIIKEWLYQLLSPEYSIVKNPGSYNSQLGVPLAVWQMQPHHTLGIFEAGISRPGEMKKIEEIIQPTLGLFTNLGTAHDEGFASQEEKLHEKMDLFDSADRIIYCSDQLPAAKAMKKRFGKKGLSWGRGKADIVIEHDRRQNFSVALRGHNFQVPFPYPDVASVENAGHCIATMLHLGYDPETIRKRIVQIKTVPMRLELKQGINHCQIIDDTYNNDLAGLQIGLNFLSGLQKEKKTVILSDILQSGLPDEVLVERISENLNKAGISRFLGVGPVLQSQRQRIESLVSAQFFNSTEALLESMGSNDFQNEAVLVKGARPFQFERIIHRLQKKVHGTVMEIDLGAMIGNLNFIKSRLRSGVKLMVMVKAFAYGSGSEEVASLLQYHKVDYLGVAYPDEGIELRKNHILLPIMVMNPSEESFATLLEYDLEPEIYSISLLQSLVAFLNGRICKVHLKVDTGMRRLGIEEQEVAEVTRLLKGNTNIQVVSVFSHLAGADEPQHDDFTDQQSGLFSKIAQRLSEELNIHPIRHLLNSAGILRFPQLQLDMVRLGIGLFGIDPTGEQVNGLRPVATLKTIISQIKKVKAGESVGYGRSRRAERDMILATIAIGYADGFSRAFSRGVGAVSIHGKLASVVGNVCMDMTMVDITGIEAEEGNEVIVFGKELPIQQVAASIHTIPYEILTNTSERVKRLFFAESI